jgi:sugar lactone lactonase YvrE
MVPRVGPSRRRRALEDDVWTAPAAGPTLRGSLATPYCIDREVPPVTVRCAAVLWSLALLAHRVYGQAAPPDPSTPVLQSRALARAADSALNSGDLRTYLADAREAARLRPQHPSLLYHLARAYVLNDSLEQGLHALARLAAMGIAVHPRGDTTFAALRGRAAFDSLCDRFDANGRPAAHSTLAFTLTGQSAFLPEGLARDPRTGAFYVGSVHQHRIVRWDDGVARTFAPGATLWSAMGMAVDTARGLLWVATSAVAEGGADSTTIGRAALAAFDLASGARRGWYPAPEDGDPHWFGDLTLADDGDVFTTDSRTPAVYRLRSLAGSLERLALPGHLQSPQGLAMAAGGRDLFVADYALGIVRIEPGRATMAVLPCPDTVTLLGIDGLYRDHNTLIGIQNGVSPHRVVRIVLDAAGTAIRSVEVLEASHPLFAEPTLGVVQHDTLFYVANSEWGRFDAAGDPARASPPRILALSLGPGDRATALTVFAPGAVSVPGDNVYRGAFDPTGTAFYFFRRVGRGEDYRIFVTHLLAGGWSAPERVFPGEYSDLYPTIAPDGTRMVFTSYRPLPGDTARARKANLWYADRTATGWGEPRYMARASTPANYDSKPVYQADGNVHFDTTLPDWRTRAHRLTRWNGAGFGPPEPDPRPVITQSWAFDDPARYYVWDAEESPDGRFALLEVSEVTGDRRGPSDLWVAFRDAAGWGRPQRLDVASSPAYDNFFLFTPDGASVLFVRGFETYYRLPVARIEALR